MTRIIKGVKCSTDTARKIVAWDSGDAQDDPFYTTEELYQTKSGKFFLHGKGGLDSTYAVMKNGVFCPGEELYMVTADAAKEYVEEHCDGETYERIFGEVPEDSEEETYSLTVQIPQSTKGKLDAIKAYSNTPFYEIVTAAIEEYAAKKSEEGN